MERLNWSDVEKVRVSSDEASLKEALYYLCRSDADDDSPPLEVGVARDLLSRLQVHRHIHRDLSDSVKLLVVGLFEEGAGEAIHTHEKSLTDAMIHGTGNLRGLADFPGVRIVGGAENPRREGLVSFALDGLPAVEIVARLNAAGIRTHTRKADHYSGNILDPLGLDACVRVSLCHYNSEAEVAAFLEAMRDIAQPG